MRWIGLHLSNLDSQIAIGIAFPAQVMAFDAGTLQRAFSVVTYPAPCTRQLLEGERPAPGTAVPLALGPRWLAYASNQARVHHQTRPLCAALHLCPGLNAHIFVDPAHPESLRMS